MKVTQTNREHDRDEPAADKTRGAVVAKRWAPPGALYDTHSPTLRLGNAFNAPRTSLHGLQAKLTVNQPGDQYEQEADRMAEQVMRMPDPTMGMHSPALHLQRKCGCGGATAAGAPCEECMGAQTQLHRSTPVNTSPAMTDTSLVHDVLNSSGRPLDPPTRAFFEQRFQQDFGHVRVHTDEQAADSARSVNAQAYTVGSNVVFGAGKYAPATIEGKKLLAHELTHVVQQNSRVSSVPVMQRKVDVAASSSVFKITQEPATAMEIKNLLGKWRARAVTTTDIKFDGSASATCGKGDRRKGYELGIVQVETKEVNNARYKGATSTDGSVWLRHDTPQVRPAGPCLDSPYAKFWHNPVGLKCGGTVSTSYHDWPGDMYTTIFENPLTHKPNYLTELHIGLEFITALMVKAPKGSLQCLRWVTWEVAWDFTFDTPASGESKIQKGSISKSSTMEFAQPEAAPPELPTTYAIPAKNCNTITLEASDNPAGVEASETW